MLELAGISNGKKLAQNVLNDGRAYKKLVEIIKEQGGNEPNADTLELAKNKIDVVADTDGVIRHIDNDIISKTSRRAGAPMDKAAGIFLYKHVGDTVKKGELLLTLYANNEERLKYAKEYFYGNVCYEIS